MRFRVKRTSDFYYSNERPRDDAIKEDTVESIAVLSDRLIWSLNIDTLEELIAFIDKLDEEVIVSNSGDDGPAIEIYDGWRE